nr:hypothetical protein BaRGS_023293 [Batillaria attramentaria]
MGRGFFSSVMESIASWGFLTPCGSHAMGAITSSIRGPVSTPVSSDAYMTWDPDENNILVIRYQGCMEFVDQHQERVIQSSTMQSLKRRQ